MVVMLGVDSKLTSLLAAKAFTINAKLVPVVDTLPPAMRGDSPKLDGGEMRPLGAARPCRI
jgi:hypothetical protein